VDDSYVLVDGPWSHRFVSANGSRFHVVEAGTGPLVLFLHGFPEFWWAWHDILPRVADAGFRAVAIDLRGYGASDKPPGATTATPWRRRHRPDPRHSANGSGDGRRRRRGGMIGWAAAAVPPQARSVRLVVLGAAHPLRLRAALFADPRGQLSATAPILQFQVPRLRARASPRTTPP
jgi:pimeloyl-ACP methyl ester carboxylesterase